MSYRSGFSTVSARQELNSGKFRLFSGHFRLFLQAWLQVCVSFEFANSGFLLVASGFRFFNKQESAENVEMEGPRVEHRHKFQSSLFVGCLAKFRLAGCFWVHVLKKAVFMERLFFHVI